MFLILFITHMFVQAYTRSRPGCEHFCWDTIDHLDCISLSLALCVCISVCLFVSLSLSVALCLTVSLSVTACLFCF